MKHITTRLAVFAALLVALSSLSCTLFNSNWGLDAVDTMQTPPDPALSCPITIPSDPFSAKRSSCAFGAGDHPSKTLGIPAALGKALPIRHVIVMMKENRSFDHIFGKLHDQGQPLVEAIPPTYSNPDLNGVVVTPFHANTTCIATDPVHQAKAMETAVAGGAMNGFVKSAAQTTGTDGHFAISYYDNSDLPFYYWLANTYSINDRHFAPMLSGTYGVRNFMMFGTNAGVVDTGISFPKPDTMSIFRTLMNAGYTWGAYSDDEPFSGTLGWTHQDPGTHYFKELLDDLDQGTLPNVAFVDGVEAVTDDHPTADLQAGEAWTRQIYDHALKSPLWPRLAIIFSYDEGGAFADHVPPPKGCLATPSDSQFTDFGPRVPLIMISPWAKNHYVSHVAHDHTAITRFIETLFDLPALTARDANSDALLDMLDFSSCSPKLLVPPPAPDVGTGGCPQH